jgi:hypothetical protein
LDRRIEAHRLRLPAEDHGHACRRCGLTRTVPLLAINEHGTRGHLKPQCLTVSGRRLVPRRAVREPDAAFPRRREMAGGNMHGLPGQGRIPAPVQ